MKKIYTAFFCNFLFVLASIAQPSVSTTAGTGSNVWPFGATATSTNNKVQWLYQSTDFVGGIYAGTITDLYFKTANPIVSTTFINLTFKMGITANTSFTTGPFLPADTVFTRDTFKIENISADGWIRIPLDVPFTYNGSDNFIVEGSHTGYTDPITVRHTNITTGNRRIYGNHLSATGTANTGQLDIGFDVATTPCPTTIGTGAVIASAAEACSWNQLTLTLQGHTSGMGQTYQWQTSTDNINWIDASDPSPSHYFATSQITTTYYRAKLQCGIGTATTSGQVVTTPTPVSSIPPYTINKNAGTGGLNFQSFEDAINHIACGISSPIVFNVVQNSGPYEEQIEIPEIAGTSAINTITINGNGNTLQFAATSGARHILQLRGTDHITVNDLTIKTTNNTYGWAVHLTNEANHVTFKRCMLDVSAVNQSESNLGNSMALLTSASYTAVAQGNNANYLAVDSCTLMGGYQTIYMAGGTSQKNKGNKLTNSFIQDFYSSGINITNQDSAELSFNDFHRKNRTTNGSVVMIDVQAGNTNMLINSNKLHDTHTAATSFTGTATGIGITNCDAPAGSENKVINNLIYRINSNGTLTGMNNNNSDGVMYYHNTVVLANTTSNLVTNTARCFNQTGQAERIHLTNNLFYIARGGTAPKHTMYFNTPATTFTSNNNILANLSTTPASNGVAFLTSNYSTLAAWKASNGNAYDQQSFDNDPVFADTINGDFTPTATALDNKGQNAGVLLDINKVARSTSMPDIGAIEWNTVLPVKLVAFAAVKKGADADLSWSTVTEERLKHFEIERSFDGISYHKTGKVVAAGNSTTLRFYSFTDIAVLAQPAVVYYRLKMIDISNAYSYSNVVMLKNGGRSLEVSVFPNPIVKDAIVKISSSEGGMARLRVNTIAGTLLGTVNHLLRAGVNMVAIPEGMLRSKGVYVVTVEVNGTLHVIQVVK